MRLSKIEESSIKNILENPEIECIGIVDPEILKRNIEGFQGVLNQYRFPSAIHYVMKVNQSKALLRKGREMNTRVDVSSYGELVSALEVGFHGDMITATGPKNSRFLTKCIEIGCVVAIDNLSELETIIEISKKTQKRQKILIRLGGFAEARETRFGILKEHWNTSLEIANQAKDFLDILGYSFHIDARGINIRQSVFWESVEYYTLLMRSGWNPRVINIGGGYGARYQDDTHILHESCQRLHLGSRLYPQDDSPVGSEFLERFLSSSSGQKGSIGKFLEENNITLWIEPGRALLSGVGHIATTIIGKRSDGHSQSLIINTNSFALGMREEELPTDPFLLGKIEEKSHTYSLLGNLCLESDIIFCRQVRLAQKVHLGDILIFPDVAAYHMDFYETISIDHPTKSRYFIQDATLLLDN